MFQKNKYYILKRRKLEKYTLTQKITNFLDDNIEIPPIRNSILINNREFLILEADNEKIRFRKAGFNTEYSKPLKEIEKNYTSREIIDRELLDLEIEDNFICRNKPNLIGLHKTWEYEYQKKYLFALTGAKIKQINIPSMIIENFYVDVFFFSFLICLIIVYLSIIYYNQMLSGFREFFSITFVAAGIIFLLLFLRQYNLVKEYERELEYRIKKQQED